MRSSNHIYCFKTVWKMLIESARITTKMLLYTLLLSFYLTSPVLGLMKVSTYNLWNIMFNWDVRKYRIARMVRKSFFFFFLSYFNSAPGNLSFFSANFAGILSNAEQCLWYMYHFMTCINEQCCRLCLCHGCNVCMPLRYKLDIRNM